MKLSNVVKVFGVLACLALTAIACKPNTSVEDGSELQGACAKPEAPAKKASVRPS